MTNKVKNILLALGLSKKAGKLVRGTPAVCDALAGGKPPELVVLSGEASANTRKRVSDKCAYYGVRLLLTEATTDELSRAVGGKGAVAAVAVTDAGLAGLVLSKAEQLEMRKGE